MRVLFDPEDVDAADPCHRLLVCPCGAVHSVYISSLTDRKVSSSTNAVTALEIGALAPGNGCLFMAEYATPFVHETGVLQLCCRP